MVERDLVVYDTVTTPQAHVYAMESGELRDLDANLDLQSFPDHAGVEERMWGCSFAPTASEKPLPMEDLAGGEERGSRNRKTS